MGEVNEALEKLLAHCHSAQARRSIPADAFVFMVDLVVYKATLHVERGESYMVVAMIQALLEFHFFEPENLQRVSLERKLGEFRKFWEGGSPRIGESGTESEWHSIGCYVRWTSLGSERGKRGGAPAEGVGLDQAPA